MQYSVLHLECNKWFAWSVFQPWKEWTVVVAARVSQDILTKLQQIFTVSLVFSGSRSKDTFFFFLITHAYNQSFSPIKASIYANGGYFRGCYPHNKHNIKGLFHLKSGLLKKWLTYWSLIFQVQITKLKNWWWISPVHALSCAFRVHNGFSCRVSIPNTVPWSVLA